MRRQDARRDAFGNPRPEADHRRLWTAAKAGPRAARCGGVDPWLWLCLWLAALVDLGLHVRVYIYNDVCSLSSCIVFSERRQLLINVFSEVHSPTQYDTEGFGKWENVFRAYGRASVYVCVCIYVYAACCKSSSSPSDCQTVLLQLRTALLLLFLPWLTLQVLSSLCSPPLLPLLCSLLLSSFHLPSCLF